MEVKNESEKFLLKKTMCSYNNDKYVYFSVWTGLVKCVWWWIETKDKCKTNLITNNKKILWK